MRPRKVFYPGVPDELGYYVYELWSGLVCLYVGRVGNSGPGSMFKRLQGHRSGKPWWPDVTDITVTAFESHDEIAEEEPRRIFELQPVYNRVYAAKCRRGHAKPPFTKTDDGRGGVCAQCIEERQQSPEHKAWVRAYCQRPEVKARAVAHNRELTESGYWQSEEYTAKRAEYMSRPEVREREQAYQAAYRNRPGRIAKELARETGHARRRYYASRNALPEVKDRKRRWALKASRRPGPGQAGLF
jgi:hypothetical protein